MKTLSKSDPRLPARLAIARYWRYLLGVTAFPAIGLLATEFIRMPPDLLLVLLFALFFASIAPAMWLLLTQKVRYSFWLVTLGVYMAAGVATSVVGLIVRAIAGRSV